MSIFHYIDATRKNYPERAKQSEYDEKLFQFLSIPAMAAGLEEFLLTPLVTYSYSRRVECVEHQNEFYILYDQYMGQTLNVFTRLAFEDGTNEGRAIYFMKYAAERLLVHGATNDALKLAAIHRSFKANSDYFSNPNATAERLSSVLIQELYLMAHEVYHWVFKLSDQLRYDAIQHADRFLLSRRELKPRFTKSANLSGQVDGEIDFKAILRSAMGADLEPDPELTLELCCDRLALNFCAMLVPQILGAETMPRVLTSCYSAHLFSRMMALLDRDMARFASGDASPKRREDDLLSREFAVHMVRKSYLRECMMYYSDAYEEGEETGVIGRAVVLKASDLVSKLFDTENAIDEKVTSPMMGYKNALISGEMFRDFSFMDDALTDLQTHRDFDAMKLAENLLGW